MALEEHVELKALKLLIAWAWALCAGLLSAFALSERHWAAAVLFFISMAAALPLLWNRFQHKQVGGGTKAIVCLASGFAALIAVGISEISSPEAKAAYEAAAREQEHKTALQRAEEVERGRVVAAEATKREQRARVERSKREAEEAATQREKVRAASPPNRVSMVNYHRIANGMTFDEVVKIIGQPDQERARNQIAGFETVVFEWVGEGWLPGSMLLTFQNGRLFQKSQSNLE